MSKQIAPAPPRPQARTAAPVLALVLALAGAALPTGASAQAAPTNPGQCPAGWVPVPPGVDPALRCLPRTLVAALPPQSAAPVAPNGCPTGWRPVAPERNPVLRCEPERKTSGRDPAGAKPLGCPAGWTSVPPGVNPVLRCLPNAIAPLARPQSAAPTNCPTGWKPVDPRVNPLMRCLPGSVATPGLAPLQGGPGTGDPGQGRDTSQSGVEPSEGGPGTGDPGQGRDPSKPAMEPAQGGPGTGDPGQGRDIAKVQMLSRDLALVDVFRIGDQAMGWGTSGTLASAAAVSRADGACRFRFVYRTRNQGAIGTAATSNRIHRDAASGAVLATSPLPALAAGTTGTSSGHVTLKPGTSMLYVHVDAPNAVAESNEANNLRRVRVTVTGDCAG